MLLILAANVRKKYLKIFDKNKISSGIRSLVHNVHPCFVHQSDEEEILRRRYNVLQIKPKVIFRLDTTAQKDTCIFLVIIFYY